MKFIVPRELSSEMAINKFFSAKDIVIVFGSVILSFALRMFVYSKFQILFGIFTILTTIFLVWKSADNKGKKNYESIYLALKRNRNTYHRIEEDY